MNRAWRVLLVVALAGSAVACGSDDGDDGDDDAAPAFEREETTTTEEEETTTTTEDEETTTTEAEDEDDEESAGDDEVAIAIAAVEDQAGDVAIFACGAAESNPDIDAAALGTALDNTYFIPAAEELVGLDLPQDEAARILADSLTDALQERCPAVADVILAAVP